MEKKKVAILNIYQNKTERGAETFVREIAKRISTKYDVDVFSDIDYLKLLKGKYDFIIPTNGRLQAILTRIIGWLTGAKIIISGQSGIGLDDRINLYTFPDSFVALSSKAAKWARATNRFVKVFKIPNGVDLKRFKPKDKMVETSDKVVISVGAFTKEKRHETTIKAVAKLKNTNLIIVGGGGEKGRIEKMGKTLLGKRFQVTSVPNEQMPNFYQKADILAFPSVSWESFGIAIVEALSSGIPVVATDDPIRREIVGNAGLFIDPTDTEAYTRALKTALETNWGDKPIKQAEKFSWDKIAKQYETLFLQLTK